MKDKLGVKAFCVHGHFYQPPREDPITGQIPLEPGAAPFTNWNERIYDQCYKPNAELGNFKHISFNVGPTLAQWMGETHPDHLEMIIKQDRENLQTYGVGNAMAQAYNHTIMPLALRHDKVTQVLEGTFFRVCRKTQDIRGLVDGAVLPVQLPHGPIINVADGNTFGLGCQSVAQAQKKIAQRPFPWSPELAAAGPINLKGLGIFVHWVPA